MSDSEAWSKVCCLLASWDRASMSLPANSKLRDGSGKSADMDLFYSHAKEQRLVPLTRRVHFNAAMLKVMPAQK